MALWLPYELAYVVPQGLLLRAGIFSKVLVNATFLLAMGLCAWFFKRNKFKMKIPAATLVSPIIYYHMSERFVVYFTSYLLQKFVIFPQLHSFRVGFRYALTR